MGASEKLKAIYEAACEPEPSDPSEVWYVDNDRAEAAVVALPQIVAVVEALERTACFDEQVGWDKCADDPPRTICSRCAALAALESALT